jgi:membrane fusion protein (multidrug efflux system)
VKNETRKKILVVVGSLGVLLVTGAVLAGLAWFKYKEIIAASSQGPPPEAPTAVGIQTIGTISWRSRSTAIGTIMASRFITVSNELPGTVEKVLFEPGAIVEEGQILLAQDTNVEKAQLKAAIAREKFTESTLRRNRQMAQTNAVTEVELEETLSQWQQATAQMAELQAIIARKTIVAPFKARAGLSDTHKGQYLPAGTMITTLQSVDDHLLVDFMVPQNVIGWLQTGQSVKLITPQDTHSAAISAIDAQADRNTRSIRVRARWNDPPASAVPGDSLQVVIEFGPETVLPAVPAESIRRSPQGTFVFVAEEDQSGQYRARARQVTLTATVGNKVALSAGVKPGEKVVVEGSFKLREGALIAETDLEQVSQIEGDQRD